MSHVRPPTHEDSRRLCLALPAECSNGDKHESGDPQPRPDERCGDQSTSIGQHREHRISPVDPCKRRTRCSGHVP